MVSVERVQTVIVFNPDYQLHTQNQMTPNQARFMHALSSPVTRMFLENKADRNRFTRDLSSSTLLCSVKRPTSKRASAAFMLKADLHKPVIQCVNTAE